MAHPGKNYPCVFERDMSIYHFGRGNHHWPKRWFAYDAFYTSAYWMYDFRDPVISYDNTSDYNAATLSWRWPDQEQDYGLSYFELVFTLTHDELWATFKGTGYAEGTPRVYWAGNCALTTPDHFATNGVVRSPATGAQIGIWTQAFGAVLW